MHRSWSKRHARPAAAASSSPQDQENPRSHPHPRLRRKPSLTQRLLGCNKFVTAEPLPTVEEKARPRTFYVPTHAAASFARTVSPRSPIRIEETNEPADGQDEGNDDDDEGGSGRSGRDKCHPRDSSNRESQHTTTTTTSSSNYTHSRSRSTKPASCYQADAPSTDYAAFLAQAEVNERAARARMAPPRRRESGRDRCQSNGSTAPGGAALRDSAYYSTGSRRSSSRGRGRGEGEDVVAPLPARRQPRTLGRRLSEYFKPPRREEGCLGEMG
ncbi:hypothetical protein C2857_004921 [Epichloe festucae Fl1]|uniref:Uncharacterized protein n=1 Tax=Epichloe festucae (strain Fl1) TaxID=877507 RepID=A0A7S9KP99_EPIFF|nr:hypothetical protein C2857_004921 [Epichloe festucae Fl1]